MSISLKKNDSPAPATTSRSKDKKTRHFPGDPRFGVALSAVDEDVTSLPPLRISARNRLSKSCALHSAGYTSNLVHAISERRHKHVDTGIDTPAIDRKNTLRYKLMS
jgi:hypothetical protein